MSVPPPAADLITIPRLRYLRSSPLFAAVFPHLLGTRVLTPRPPLCRVRCDLKDLPVSKACRHPSCSNCKDRDFKCVYVSLSTYLHSPLTRPPVVGMNTIKSSLLGFSGADVGCNKQSTSSGLSHMFPGVYVSSSSLSSRALYGKVKAGDDEDMLSTGLSPPPNVTPMPTPAFFESQFWRPFQLQHAHYILDQTINPLETENAQETADILDSVRQLGNKHPK